MENNTKGFQAMRVTFNNPETGKQFEQFFVCLSSLTPEQFNDLFRSDNHTVGECINIQELSAVFNFEDIAAYPEFKELLEAMAEGMEATAG